MGFEIFLTPAEMRLMYRHMIIAGLEPGEAGNLVATAVGLRPIKQGWKIQEIINLQFIEYIKHSIRS